MPSWDVPDVPDDQAGRCSEPRDCRDQGDEVDRQRVDEDDVHHRVRQQHRTPCGGIDAQPVPEAGVGVPAWLGAPDVPLQGGDPP